MRIWWCTQFIQLSQGLDLLSPNRKAMYVRLHTYGKIKKCRFGMLVHRP